MFLPSTDRKMGRNFVAHTFRFTSMTSSEQKQNCNLLKLSLNYYRPIILSGSSLLQPFTPETNIPVRYIRLRFTPRYLLDNLVSGQFGSSVASPICQEGQSERTFPIFAFSSRFFLFFPDFSPIFGKFFAVRGGTLPPLTP